MAPRSWAGPRRRPASWPSTWWPRRRGRPRSIRPVRSTPAPGPTSSRPATPRSTGVTVHRFAGATAAWPDFYVLDARLRRAPQLATLAEARAVGRRTTARSRTSSSTPWSAADADVVAFYPYLYHPTVAAIGRVTVPAVLHPAAHDEPALYLPVFGRTFGDADAFCYHTRGRAPAGGADLPGGGPAADRTGARCGRFGRDRAAGGRDAAASADRPYIVSVGRVDEHKGSKMLLGLLRRPTRSAIPARWPWSWSGRSRRRAGPTSRHRGHRHRQRGRQVGHRPRRRGVGVALRPRVVLPGRAGGMGRRRPGPGQRRAASRPWSTAERSGGGLWFTSYLEFDAVLRRLIDDPQLRRSLGGRGRAYVEGHYRWPELIARYADFLERVVARGTRRTSGPVPVASSSRSA